jgi:hypothetical protein
MRAAKQGPTLSARSLTCTEARARDRRFLIWAPTTYAALMTIPMMLMASREGRAAESDYQLVSTVVIFCGIALIAIGLIRADRRSKYQDPHMTIEVRPSDLMISTPERSLVLDYAELDLSPERLVQVDQSGRHVTFTGLTLQTAIGPIRVDDDWFEHGLATAAMIAVHCEKEGVLLDSLVEEARRDAAPA